MKKLQLSPGKLVLRPEADSSDLCGADIVPRTPQPISRTPQLPPGFNKASHTAKAFFFLAASQLMAKKLNALQKDDQFLKYCTVVT